MTLEGFNTGIHWKPWVAKVPSSSHKEVCRVGKGSLVVRYLDLPFGICLGPFCIDNTVIEFDELLEVVLISDRFPVCLDLSSSGVIG